MLPIPANKRGAAGKRLQALFEDLPEHERRTLLAFAEFLASRAPKTAPVAQTPVPQPRPEKESVVKAVRRLSATYPMLDKAKMLNQTSALMAQHVMHGRAAVEVIDELEVLFESHYNQYRKDRDEDSTE
ncbi:Crp/Fnr family transcriptional regulator [Acidihalobacter yilgarnensis]|uniref:Crp/Fnr family transcriptional regulator n=1 Tax=Acidihalobacter yilgarnensis TaxID=2819280 RepID=A0A1D8IQ14_9GAMM|nr:Crp/Fnr family transcriptional regulator [Acidihalobacter yilgarnensis]AOU98590.1 Crp/Fnr family transcriptional regulator [Acidihalobacter yilgarnensis]